MPTLTQSGSCFLDHICRTNKSENYPHLKEQGTKNLKKLHKKCKHERSMNEIS